MANNKMECTFLWFIENYSYCWQQSGEKFISPIFTANGLQGTTWTLLLYPRGKNYEERDSISIYLIRNADDGPYEVSVNYHLSIVAEDGSTSFSKNYTSNFYKNSVIGWKLIEIDDILTRRKAAYLPNDILTVRCKLSIGEENPGQVKRIYGRTRIGIGDINFHHTVEGFSTLKPNQKKSYRIHSLPQRVFFKSCVYISDGSCCEENVMLEIMPSDKHLILVKCEVFLLDTYGKKIKCAEADNRSDAKRKGIRKLPLSLSTNAIMNKKSEYLPDDKLSLLCECTFSKGIEYQKIEGNQNEITTTVAKITEDILFMKYANIYTEKFSSCPNALDDLNEIYQTKFLTDVELKTKENSFPAHKIVLCARSPAFKTMMSCDMKEKNSDLIQVDDLEDDIVQKLLLFLYSDQLEDLQWETATKLYYAADKYQIDKLRLICSWILIKSLSTSTASELLLLADTHSDSDLQQIVEDFILDHDKQVFGSGEWEKLIETNPHLALRTMHLKYKTKEMDK